ncbi:hypothetical protein J6590_033339 [Homalodisca vitripennis]|nr:hypothetical protein J6590_033339 [Homalodisca vitripennis]
MAPGTSSMLRARRRDVNVKPNRVLDRNSSRGMIYENEELRLRTININAEVEKGHSDIKKLRLENDRLRREIWNLRDEYDRLEALYKAKQLSMDTEEEELESEDQEAEGEGEPQPEDRDETAEDNIANQRKDGDVLSVVEEEPEDLSDNGEDHRQRTVSFKDENLTVPGKSQQSEDVETLPCWPDDSYIPGPQIPVPRNPFPGLETLLRNVTAEQQDQMLSIWVSAIEKVKQLMTLIDATEGFASANSWFCVKTRNSKVLVRSVLRVCAAMDVIKSTRANESE